MAESLIDLDHVLRSKQDKLTRQEENFLMTWKENALRQITVGAGAGAAIAWSATGSLHRLYRIQLAGGAGIITAMWRFRRSISSCIEQILCMDGTRMQKDLANIMLRRYPNHPATTNLISKRFYRENVFDDSTSGMPKSRWRFRNNFVEVPQPTDSHESDGKLDQEHKPVPMNDGFVMMENPLDCVFGFPPSIEEIRRPVPVPGSSVKKHSRKHRRRSHRRNHDENL